MKQHIYNTLKGIAMGAANVIPGVSGGTIALITGIFERLINAIKSIDITALKLLFSGKFKELAKHIDLVFLITIFSGVFISIMSLAKLLDFLFVNYPIFIWSYFFGLILASVYFVARTVSKWSTGTVISFIIGTAIALGITLIKPATENEQFLYLILCGIVGVCSMILPGLSGSFILILMGNYQLILKSISDLNIDILVPLAIGVIVGLLLFSHLLSWIYKKFKDITIGVLSGFILGSLSIIWPWKQSFDQNDMLININEYGALTDSSGKILQDIKVYGYKQLLPEEINLIVVFSIALIIVGIISIWAIEKYAYQKESNN